MSEEEKKTRTPTEELPEIIVTALSKDGLLHENDQDLYGWVTGQSPAPERYSDLISQISKTFDA